MYLLRTPALALPPAQVLPLAQAVESAQVLLLQQVLELELELELEQVPELESAQMPHLLAAQVVSQECMKFFHLLNSKLPTCHKPYTARNTL